MGLSPFHEEKRRVLWFLPTNKFGRDFSSGKVERLSLFHMEIEGFTYPEALRHAQKIWNREIEEIQIEYSEEQKKHKPKEKFYIKFTRCCQYFFQETFGKPKKEKPSDSPILRNVNCMMTSSKISTKTILRKEKCF